MLANMYKTLNDRWRRDPWRTFFQLLLLMVAARLLLEFGSGFVDGMIEGFRD